MDGNDGTIAARARNPFRLARHPWDTSFLICVAATLAMVALSAIAPPKSTYRFSFAFLSPVQWLAYAGRRKLRFGPAHLALVASALIFHNLGVFGFYRREFFSLQFDTYVHFYFGMVGGFLLQASLGASYGLRGWRIWIAVTIGILGCGAIHELIEFASTLALGPERGMLKALADDPYDTQKDLLNNLLGTLLSLLLATIGRQRRKVSSQS